MIILLGRATAPRRTDPATGTTYASVRKPIGRAVPGIARYTGLPRGVLGDDLVPPIRRLAALWGQFTGAAPLTPDGEGRIRPDTFEPADHVRAAVAERRESAGTETIAGLADLDRVRTEVRRLHGFSVPDVDCTAPVATDVPWPDHTL
ncbi:hypothetical protein [Kitasatospora sp. NPDC057015]|uniref:hypothetical protein n=1 Tax=Kitasatospora sp. NPDC057015 TaxID=3346001 RepID=UPI00363647BF